jgi:predicted exporter
MQFRGFRQFGVIGGLGMAFAWLTTVVLMPPLCAWLDRGGHGPVARPRERRVTAWLARLVARRPRAVMAAAGVVTLLAAWQFQGFGRDRLEYDFSRLRRSDTWKLGEGYWGRKMDKLLQRYLTPTAVLADSEAEARAIRDRIVAAMSKPPLAGLVASVRTWDDVAPPDQDAKAAEIAIIRRKLTANVREHVAPAELVKLDRLLGTGAPARVDPGEIPDVLTRGLRERDGSTGRTVLVFPNPAGRWWQGETITSFVRALRAAAEAPVATGGRPARVAGGHALSADIIASMERDGPLASLLAFLGVLATVLLVFRGGLATPYVIGSLVVGVLWLIAATMALGIKINFVNFIAFPITLGIGVDYSVNVMARYLRDGARDVSAAVRGAGGAVALCSFTTIAGYSSLLLAKNVGLFLFGVVAVLGEITCLTTALVVLPAVLISRSRGAR